MFVFFAGLLPKLFPMPEGEENWDFACFVFLALPMPEGGELVLRLALPLTEGRAGREQARALCLFENGDMVGITEKNVFTRHRKSTL